MRCWNTSWVIIINAARCWRWSARWWRSHTVSINLASTVFQPQNTESWASCRGGKVTFCTDQAWDFISYGIFARSPRCEPCSSVLSWNHIPVYSFLAVSRWKGQSKLALISENEGSHCFCRNDLDSSLDLMHFRRITHEPPYWPIHGLPEKTQETSFLPPISCYRVPTEQAGVTDFSKGRTCSLQRFCSAEILLSAGQLCKLGAQHKLRLSPSLLPVRRLGNQQHALLLELQNMITPFFPPSSSRQHTTVFPGPVCSNCSRNAAPSSAQSLRDALKHLVALIRNA